MKTGVSGTGGRALREPRFNEESLSYKVLLAATEFIFADIRQGGPWASRVVAAKSPQQTRTGRAQFDGPARKPSLSEKLKKLEPLPPSASVEWQDDTTLIVFAFGLAEGEVPFARELIVSNDDVEPQVPELVELVAQALASIDPERTDSIKVPKLPKSFAEQFPWMMASESDKRPDPWNA